MKRILSVISGVAICLTLACSVKANELLINGNGNRGAQYSPLFLRGSNSQGLETQTLYLAEQLADMSEGDTIHALTFYFISEKSDTIKAVYAVRLLETDNINTDFGLESTSNATLVYEGQLPCSDGDMRIEFTTPYIYHGGNLVIDFYVQEPSSVGISGNWDWFCGSETGYYVHTEDQEGGQSRDNIQAKVLIEYTFSANQCHRPTHIRLDEVSYTDVTVSWSPSGSESSWEVTVDSITTVVSTPSYTITSLSSATAYSKLFGVRSICAVGDTSDMRNITLSFVTECYDASLPYVHDFENDIPGTTHPCWYFSNNVSIAANASYAHDGTNYLSLDGTSGGVYAISPKLSQPVKEVVLSFYEQEHGQYRYSWVYKNCIVGSITDPSDFSTFTPLDTLPSSQENYQWVERLMNDAPETDYYILFYYNGYNVARVNSFCYIDSIQISLLPTCLPVTDVHVDSVGITTAELSWTPGKDEQAWDVMVLSASGDTLYNNTVDTNHCIIPSLVRDSLYSISAYIRANCQEGDTSRVTATTLTFTTKATCFPVSDIRLDTVLATTAELSWSPGKDEQAWDVLVLSAGGDTLFNNTVTTNHCTIPDLTHRTPYTISAYVRANCGDGDLGRVTSATFSFETSIACGTPIVTLPFTENFESTSTETKQMPSCWSHISSDTYYVPYVKSNYTCHSCDNTLYFYGYIYYQYGVYAILPEFSMDVNKLQISLWAINALVDPTHGSFIVGAMSNPTDSTTFFPIDTLAQSEDFTEHVVYLDRVPAGYKYIAIMHKRLASGTSWLQPEAQIDDVTVDWAPGCLSIEDIRLDTVIANNALFSWTPMRENPYGFKVTVKNEYDDSVLLSDTVFSPSLLLTDLDFSSDYRLAVSVATICQPGNIAEPYEKTFFVQTECHAIDSLYRESFEHFVGYPYKAQSITTPNCWDVINANSPYFSQRIYVTDNASFVRKGKQSLLFQYSYDKPSYAIMPEMGVDLSTRQISFFYHLIGSYHPGKLTFGYFPKDSLMDSAFVVLVSLPNTTTWDSLKNYRLENVPKDVRLAFKYHTPNMPNGCNMTDAGIAIDDILIEEINNCHPPLRVWYDSLTSSSVRIHWTPEFEDNTHFNVAILNGKDTLFYAKEYPDTMCVIEGLQVATKYFLTCYTSTACSDRTSDILKSYVSFVTECAPFGIPFTEDFQSYPGIYAAGNLPFCWTLYGDRRAGLLGWGNGEAVVSMYADSMSWSMVGLPELEASVDTLSISFLSLQFNWYEGEDASLEVGYMLNPTEESSFAAVATIPVYEEYTLSTVDFHTTPESVHYIAFRFAGGSGVSQLYLDDIIVDSAPNREESVELTDDENHSHAIKFIRGGQLYILRDGRIYTLFGIVIDENNNGFLK